MKFFKNDKKVFKLVLFVLGCIITLFLLAKNFSIAVLVNNKPIFNKRINHLFETEFKGFEEKSRDQLLKQQGKRILEKEIDRQLILQEGKKQGIIVSSEEIEQIIKEKIKERNYSDVTTYVHDYKTTLDDLKLEFKVELTSVKILGKNIIESDEKIKTCYKKNGWIIWRCNQDTKELFFKKIGERYSPWLSQLRNSSNIRYFVSY